MEQYDDLLRTSFKTINKVMLLNWRLGMGPYLSILPRVMGRYLVLVHTGRKTGLKRHTPVNYVELDDDIYITAGFGSVSHWYRNIQANPHIEVWLPDGWWQAEAKDITAQEQHTAIMREVLKNSGFAAFAAGINPYTVSDEALEKATADYRLLHIRRTAPCAGPGGPGDLVWMWPVLLVVALFARFRWVVRK